MLISSTEIEKVRDAANWLNNAFFLPKQEEEGSKLMMLNTFKILQVNVQSLVNKLNNPELLFAMERPLIASAVEHWCSSGKLYSMIITLVCGEAF